MTAIKGRQADVHFGQVGQKLPNWRTEQADDFDPDDELLDATPASLIAVLGFDPRPQATAKAEKNCGAGAPGSPGFQPGNTCASGGSGSVPTEAAARARYEELAGEVTELYSANREISKRLADARDHSKALDYAWASHEASLNYQERSKRLYQMTTERMQFESADPARYRQAREEWARVLDEWQQESNQVNEELLEEGVHNKEWFNGHDAAHIGHLTDAEGSLSALRSMQNLTPEMAKRCHDLYLRKPNEYTPRDWEPAYYGEPSVVRSLAAVQDTTLAYPDGVSVSAGGGPDDLVAFTQQAQISMQMSAKAATRIAASRDGKIKNGLEGGAVGSIGKGKKNYWDARREGESRIFGIDESASGADRPVYGYLEHPDRSLSLGGTMSDPYGEVQVVFKPEVRSRTSFTVGDSLDHSLLHGYVAGALNNPPKNVVQRPATYGPSKDDWVLSGGYGRPPYIEAQLHGGVYRKDIAEVRAPKGALPEKALTHFKKHGVPVVTVPRPHATLYHPRPWDDYFKED